jgi:flagellar capping protein FliD
LVVGDGIVIYSFFVMQRTGDCDFFAWANKEMTTYETKIMERLKVLDDRRKADSDRLKKLIEKKYNDQYVKLEKLIEKKKYNDQYVKLQRELELCQTNGKIF